jgi:hypothetical protein
MAAFLLAGCAPVYDPVTTSLLASVKVSAAEIAGRCPAVAAPEIHAALIEPLLIAAETVRYRPNAVDVLAAIGELRAMAGGFETLAAGRMTRVYCAAKAGDIVEGADRVLRVWETLE